MYPPYPRDPLTPCFSFTKAGNLTDELRRDDAIALLREAASRVRRRGSVPFYPSFVLAGESDSSTRLAKLIQGGRGGEVRLRLYLCITMMATGRPYDLKRSPAPSRWASLLALPEEGGSRRVSSNLKWLADHNYIKLERRSSHTPIITLLSADGSGGEYISPRGQGRYLGVPVELWTQGWIINLSATALALLFCLLELLGGHKKARYVTQDRRARYGLSSDTWTRATTELALAGILAVGQTPQGGDFDYKRLRNTYWVDLDRLKGRSDNSSSTPLVNFEN